VYPIKFIVQYRSKSLYAFALAFEVFALHNRFTTSGNPPIGQPGTGRVIGYAAPAGVGRNPDTSIGVIHGHRNVLW
jgi:hypothetical protein